MEIVTTSSNRDLILHILMKMTGEKAVYSYAPEFAYTVGGYIFRRDAVITCESDYANVYGEVASLGLCEESPEGVFSHQSGISAFSRHDQNQTAQAPDIQTDSRDDLFTYPMAGHNGKTLLNLIGIFSARQRLINQAIDAPVFHIDPEFVRSLYDHPPVTISDFLIAIYEKDDQYDGISFSMNYIRMTGFTKARHTDHLILKQLSDAIIQTALQSSWIKPFTRNVRNRKYAMHTWLNEIGMTGPEYEEARAVLLGRLYGKTSSRKL